MLYQMVELEEGVDVQYLGVYALKWRHDEWGPPSVGFMERNVFNLMITYICAHCGRFAEVCFLEVEVFDSGTTLACNRCGKDTILDLSTLEERKELILKRTMELLVAAGHVTEEQVEKARKLAISLGPASPGPGGHLYQDREQENERLLNGIWEDTCETDQIP